MPKISQLPAASSLSNTDILMVDTYGGTNSRKIAYGDLKSNIQEDSKAVFALKGETATDAQVSTAVSNWLSSHVTPTGSAVVIDDTLTIAGAAADAQAAGVARGKIPIVTAEATSKATAFNATLVGATELTEGLTFYLYNATVTRNNYATTDSIPASEWSTQAVLSENNLASYKSALIYLYQRATSTPSRPSATLTYTFSSGALSGTLGNWSTTVPSGTNQLYVTAATAYSSGTTDTIASAEWTAPAALVENMASGSTGINAASVFLYQRASSSPTKPSSALTYTFATGALSGSLGSWSQTIPESGTGSCYEIHATAMFPGQQTTLNLNTLGAKPMYTIDGRALPPESIMKGDILLVTYSTLFVSSGCWIVRLNPVVRHGEAAMSAFIPLYTDCPSATGRGALAIGGRSVASGLFSFAMGSYNTAGGLDGPHATGSNSIALGLGAQATKTGAISLGQGNIASGGVSFATGSYNQAKGSRGFVAGNHTISSENTMSQAVFGNANVEDVEGKYAFIVGNGKVSTGSGTGLHPEIYEPSNALALDWEGNLELAGGVSFGGNMIYPSTAERILSQSNAVAYTIYTPLDEYAFGNIDSETGADTSNGSLSAVRTTSYLLVNAGDILRFANASTYRCYVGEYLNRDGSYVYQGALKLTTDTAVTELVIQRDAYIRVVISKVSGNIGGSTDIYANRAAVEQALASYKQIRYGAAGASFVDEFEWGSLLTDDISNGLLGNDIDYFCNRTKKLYDVSKSKLFGVIFSPEDLGYNETIVVNILYYYSDFSQVKVISRYIDKTDCSFSTLVYDNYPYAMVFIQRFNTETKQFHAVNVHTDGISKALYLPRPPSTTTATPIIMQFNYRVFGDVMTSGRLILPPNYSMTGKKVPMAVYVHGSQSVSTWTGGWTEAYIPYLNYLSNEGFAVFDCYPWTNKVIIDYENWSPILMPLHQRSYIEGIKYVCQKFNVDIDNVVLVCKSQGGHLGHWAYIQKEFPFRAVGLLSPTIDYIGQKTANILYGSALRRSLPNYIDFEGTTEELNTFISNGRTTNATVMSFLVKNKSKFTALMPHGYGLCGCTSLDELFYGGINTMETVPSWLLADGIPDRQDAYDLIPEFAEHSNYSKTAICPVKFWAPFDDASVSTYANYAMHKYLLNGGSNSEFRVMPNGTGGHHAVDSAENALKSSGTTALGITYTNMPTAFVELVAFFNKYIN